MKLNDQNKLAVFEMRNPMVHRVAAVVSAPHRSQIIMGAMRQRNSSDSAKSTGSASSKTSSDSDASERTSLKDTEGSLRRINAGKQRNKELHRVFNKRLCGSEVCVADFICAYAKTLLLRQGKMYMTCSSVCFVSGILDTEILIPLGDIVNVRRSKTIGIPNAITIETRTDAYFFSSFMSRENAYKTLMMLVVSHRSSANGSKDDLDLPILEAKQIPAAKGEHSIALLLACLAYAIVLLVLSLRAAYFAHSFSVYIHSSLLQISKAYN